MKTSDRGAKIHESSLAPGPTPSRVCLRHPSRPIRPSPRHPTHPKRTNRSGFVRVLGSVKVTSTVSPATSSLQVSYQNYHDRTVLEIIICPLRLSSIPYWRRQRPLGITSFVFRCGRRWMYTLGLAPSRRSHTYPQFRAHLAENLPTRVTRFSFLPATSLRASLARNYHHARDRDPPGNGVLVANSWGQDYGTIGASVCPQPRQSRDKRFWLCRCPHGLPIGLLGLEFEYREGFANLPLYHSLILS